MTDYAPLLTAPEPQHEQVSRFGADLHDIFAAGRLEQLDDSRFARLGDSAPRLAQADLSAESRVRMAVADARHGNDLGFFADVIGYQDDNRSLQERAPHALRVPLETFLAEANEKGEVQNAATVLDWISAAARPNFERIVHDTLPAEVRSGLTMGPDALQKRAKVPAPEPAAEARSAPAEIDADNARRLGAAMTRGRAMRDQVQAPQTTDRYANTQRVVATVADRPEATTPRTRYVEAATAPTPTAPPEQHRESPAGTGPANRPESVKRHKRRETVRSRLRDIALNIGNRLPF
jgi:hypothetical protein